MALVQAHNRWVITLSFMVALILAVYPLPVDMQWWRPQFVTLVLIYWVIVMPQQLSMLMVWLLGCCVDLFVGTLLGQHALCLMAVAYVCVLSYQRIRSYGIWQQSFLVFVVVGIQQLLGNWVHSLYGSQAPSLVFLLPALMSALCWPLVWVYLDSLRAKYRIT